ncbi:fimbrial assembly family protein [Calothrix sp. NIES-4071]|nr:fimbrial assembly family protein [Calothrix sp. NIES-4071]BAZ58262.1 fimbrial assembly family protein [Calothrix sp. NIES-4105]
MYSLDVNFLKDRAPSSNPSGGTKIKMPVAASDLTPLYIGGAVAAFCLAIVGTGWWILQTQNEQLQQNIAKLDQENQQLEAQIGNINKIKQQITQVKSETQALVTVFDQIRPWSAILQDVRERIPASVQLDSLKHIAAAAPVATPEGAGQPEPSKAGAIEIGGFARSFSDVNDFLVTLQQSRFLKAKEVRITNAELTEAPAPPIPLPPGAKLPKVVKYTIQSSLSDVPASELMRELEQKGTVGLVARIRSLQQTGALQR